MDVPVDAPEWRRDFPYTSEGEDDVTRREFVRYLVLASGTFAAGTVATAVWASLRPINHGEPRPIVALDDVPTNGTYLFRYPTDDDPAILVRLSEDRIYARRRARVAETRNNRVPPPSELCRTAIVLGREGTAVQAVVTFSSHVSRGDRQRMSMSLEH